MYTYIFFFKISLYGLKVRKRYSWIPKELIARFVRHCPFCISRRNGHLSRPATATITNGNESMKSTLLSPSLSLSLKNNNEEINDDQSILSSPTMIQSTITTNHHQHDYNNMIPNHHNHQQQQQMMYQAPWMTSSPSNPSTIDSPLSSIATEAAAKVNYDQQQQQQGSSLYYYPYNNNNNMASPPYSNTSSRSNSTASSCLLQPPPTPTTHMDFNELNNNNNNNDQSSSYLFNSSSPMTNTTINTPSPDTISKPCFSPSTTPYNSNCFYASDSPSIDLLSHQQLI